MTQISNMCLFTKNLSSAMKNEAADTKMNLEMLKQANLEARVFKSESLQEHVAPVDVGEEHINCWGCHKEFRNSRYLEAHQAQKKDCPAYNDKDRKYQNLYQNAQIIS